MPWNPEQYHKFQSQRSAPFFDLLKLVEVRPNISAVDLGCGTGELTRKITVEAHHFSKSALEKIQKAGGTAPVVGAKTE